MGRDAQDHRRPARYRPALLAPRERRPGPRHAGADTGGYRQVLQAEAACILKL